MELKPGYKQTDIGIIPDDWDLLSLEDIADPKRPICYGIVQTGRPVNNGIRCIRVVDIVGGRVDPANLIMTSPEISMAYKRTILSTGDLVIALRGKIGELALINDELVGANLTRGVALLAPKDGYDSQYLYHALSSPRGKQILEKNLNGSALQEIPIATLRKIPAAIPPPPEQRAIADVLSDVNALIRSLNQLIAKEHDLKQATMQELLTGEKRLPGFIGEWEIKALRDVADIDPENLGSETSPNYSFKYISLEDVDRGTLRAYSNQVFRTAPSRARRKLRRGDVLVSTVRPNLQSHLFIQDEVIDTVCSTGFTVLRCKPDSADPGYVYFHLFGNIISRQIESLLIGSNYPAINSGDVKALRVPFPSTISEQAAIAEVLKDMNAEIEALEQKRDKTHAIKQGMMQELLTGRIRLI